MKRLLPCSTRSAKVWELVYVNDGSKDSSLDLLKELQASDPGVVVVDLSRNWGHMGAISAGLQTARGDAVILMDGDFQDPPEVLPELVEAWHGGAQVVAPSGEAVRSGAKSRQAVSALLPCSRCLVRLSDSAQLRHIRPDGPSGRRLGQRPREGNRYLPGLRAWVGYKNAVVYYDRHDRLAGDGKLSFISRIKYAMDAITSFSYKPLRVCFALCCLSFLLTIGLGIGAIFSSSAVTAAGLGMASAVFLVGGFMLFCMGVLGEYVGRVYDEVRRRPLSIINQVYYAPEMALTLPTTEEEYEEADQRKIYRIA